MRSSPPQPCPDPDPAKIRTCLGGGEGDLPNPAQPYPTLPSPASILPSPASTLLSPCPALPSPAHGRRPSLPRQVLHLEDAALAFGSFDDGGQAAAWHREVQDLLSGW